MHSLEEKMSGDISVKNRNKLLAERVIKNLKARKIRRILYRNCTGSRPKSTFTYSVQSFCLLGRNQTMEELKVLEAVRSDDYNAIDRDTAKTPEERQELMHKAFLPTFISPVSTQ